ncbi:MAG: hypothetical protein HY854_15265 [Burkholderiales bacterium]|nr:hypothetical protein [Burkholderiales bacterium]
MAGTHKGNGRKWLRLALAPVAGFAVIHAASAQVPVFVFEPPTRLEVAATPSMRADAIDAASAAQRVDLTLLPPRPSAVGLAVGVRGFSAPSTITGAGLAPTMPPAVDLGLHMRHTLDSNHAIGLTAWRRVPQAGELPLLMQEREPTYGARVELNLSPQRAGKSSFDSERGFIGMQLENGGRISIRRKHGGPMVYYRVRF